jgi:hypothetical protein
MPVPIPAPIPMSGQNKGGKPGSLLPKILIAAAAVVLVVVLAILVPKIITNLKGAPDGLLYLKDNELNYTSLSKVKPKEITEELYEDGTIEAEDASSLSFIVTLSEDGKRLFYPDRVTDADEGFTLYYRNLNSKKTEGEKIDSDIMLYQTNTSGTKIVYIKGSERNLYSNDLKDKEKIDSEISTFYMNDSGSKIIYVDSEGSIYGKEGKKDREKIDSNSSIIAVFDNLNTIYYLKDGSLYVKKGDKDKEKIDSEVSSVVKVYESGKIYYLKTEDTELKLADFVNDDLKATDATMTEPVEPTYPYYEDYKPTTAYPVEPDYYSYTDYWGYIDWDTYNAAYSDYQAQVDAYNQEWDNLYNEAMNTYNEAYNAYQESLNDWYAKQSRDDLRASIAEETLTSTSSILYYYDTKEAKLITDSYSSYLDYSYDKPVILYENYNKAELTKVNISEITSYDEVYNMANEALSASTEVYVATEANAVALEQNEGSSFMISDEEDAIYYLDDYDAEEGSGDLYEAKISGNKLAAPTKLEEDVYSFNLLSDDHLVYFKDVKDSSGDLYQDKELIDSDVYVYSVNQLEEDELIYYVDYSYDKELGTLTVYNGKDSSKVGDDIHDYYAFDKKCVVYLQDFSLERGKGDVYLYEGSDKKKTIDQDVTAIIPIYENSYRGSADFDYGY